jgi:hypothetical protein
MGWAYISAGENKECTLNFDPEILRKITAWKTKKEMGIALKWILQIQVGEHVHNSCMKQYNVKY